MPDWDKKLPEKPAEEKAVTSAAKKEYTAEDSLVENWDEEEHETIMIFGAEKTGKTQAYMPMIKEAVDNGGHVFIVNTDDGIVRTFKKYFDDVEERKKMRDNISFYYIGNIERIYSVIETINKCVKPNDLVVIDLVSEITWEMPQAKFIEDSSGNDPVAYIIKAQKDKKMFGLLEGTKWQYVKKIESALRKGLILHPRCNVVGICTEKNIDVEKAMAKQTYHKYDITGTKPGGSKELPYDFNSLVYIGMQPNGGRYFQVLGDRGSDINQSQRFEFGKDFYTEFKKIVER